MRHNLRESLNTDNVHNRTKLIHDTINNLRNIYDNTHFRESCLNDFLYEQYFTLKFEFNKQANISFDRISVSKL